MNELIRQYLLKLNKLTWRLKSANEKVVSMGKVLKTADVENQLLKQGL